MAACLPEAQLGHMLGMEMDPGVGVAFVSVVQSMIASSKGYGAVEEIVFELALCSLWFLRWSVVAWYPWQDGRHLWTAVVPVPMPEKKT